MITVPDTSPETIAHLTAKALIDIGAVHVSPSDPFTYTSGLKSPVYVDCRTIISFPRVRAQLIGFAVALMARRMSLEGIDAIAGGETAGIPFAALIAERLALPMQYVRKAPKGFGRLAQIEGVLNEGQHVLLVEDLATDGGSKLKFAAALRDAGATVSDCLVIFHHDVFPASAARLGAEGLAIHALARWSDVIAHARTAGTLGAEDLDEVDKFLAAPLAWSAARGGIEALPPA
ncbi:MAG: orotate phosphoribosyltransferase [Pseudomonadota bacterium]